MFERKLRFRKKPLMRQNAVEEKEEDKIVVAETINSQRRFDDIQKSQQDVKNYRAVVLENGLKVLLVSDPTTVKSAACMCVEVGHMSDPVDVPGLAHLTEHALFLGSERFPNENDFRSFISEHGGMTNAQTFADVTKYFFDISPEKLSEALEIFSQMFIAPLLNESSITREISAVNNEHEKNLASDSWRIRMVNKTIANPCHPYSKFSTGNTRTLLSTPQRHGINLRDELIAFYDEWYRSGNLMNLAIFGKDSLDELEIYARKYFLDGIENKAREIPRWSDRLYEDFQLMTKTYIEPLKDVRTMTLSFQTPDLMGYYKSRPEEFIVNLVAHEGPGSVLSELKHRGWSSTLNCDHISYANGFGFFEIKVDMTDEGFLNRDKIVKLIFQYLNMIRSRGLKEWIFEEYKTLAEIDFKFEDQKKPIDLVKQLASAMRHYPLPEVLTAPALVTEWRPELVEFVLNMLTPSNVRITIVDQSLYWKCGETEEIYNTKYGTEKISQPVIRDWTICGLDPSLFLPAENIFIPTDFEFLPITNWKQTYPKIIRDTSLARVWFKQDTEFRKPKSIMTIELKNATINSDPLSWNMIHMFVWLLEDHLKEKCYPAELAGQSCRISVTTGGIRLHIDGYSHKQDIFLQAILNEIFRFKIDRQRLEDTYDAYLTDLKSFKSDKPQQVAIYYLGVILTEQMWSNEELIQAMKFVTLDRIKTFVKEVLTQAHAECFIFGNVNEDKALKLSKLIEDRLNRARAYNMSKSKVVFILASTTMRERKLPEGVSHIFQSVNSHHRVNCTSLYVQCGVQDDKSNVVLDLILQILREPFFNVLRTQEQQGYLVDCLIRRSHNTQGIKFVVESTKHPEYIEQRISRFLDSMGDEIAKMSAEKFEAVKKVLKVKKTPKLLTLSDQFWQFYREISNQQYHFNRVNVEASLLKEIAHEEVLNFYQTFIAPQSSSRSSMSIHVLRDDRKLTREWREASPLENHIRIDDVNEFKSTLQLFPRFPRKSLRQFYIKRK